MPEEDAFCILVRLMEHYGLRELFKPSMADLEVCFYQLEKLIFVSVCMCMYAHCICMHVVE